MAITEVRHEQSHLTVTEQARLRALGPGAFRVQSWKGMAFEVHASIDLKQWSPVTTVTTLTGTLEFTDPDAAILIPHPYAKSALLNIRVWIRRFIAEGVIS